MLKVIMTKGLPASGKSTWAKASGLKRINKDDLRAMLDAGTWSPESERFIVKARNTLLERALRMGFDVVLDDTNLNTTNWKAVCDLIESTGLEVHLEEKCFDVPVSECVFRDSRRAATIGHDVIEGMHKRYVKANKDVFVPKTKTFAGRANAELPVLVQDPSLPKAVICDLDGTLALIGDRSPYDASTCHLVDKPNPPVVEAVKLFHAAGYKILFVSGREDKYVIPTARFIDACLPGLQQDVEATLFMRATDDKRKDTVVKREIYERAIKGKYNVLCAIDDRPSVVRMWRYDLGLAVFALNDKEF